MSKTPKNETAGTVGVNIRLPAETHRRARAAAALRGFGWDAAVEEALSEWARVQIAKEAGRR
jgi:predicted HicB family RNase H-like nuclease